MLIDIDISEDIVLLSLWDVASSLEFEAWEVPCLLLLLWLEPETAVLHFSTPNYCNT